MAAATMMAKDSVSAKMAECYVRYKGKRYNMMNAINVEATVELKKSEVPILGKTAVGKKPNGWEGTGSATFHFNNSLFRSMINSYKKTGAFIYFDMEIVNSDPTTSVGSQIVKLKNCCMDSVVLAKFDASSDDSLEEDMDFTFDDFEYAKGFTNMAGFVTK
jgi:hypothetical protein